jgi:hypothetical protein
MRGKVSAHEIYTAGNKHSDPSKVYRGSTDVINEFAKLDVAGSGATASGRGRRVAGGHL